MDEVLVLYPKESGPKRTKDGERDCVVADVRVLDYDRKELSDPVECWLFQQVLIEATKDDLGGIVVGRLIRPGRAYLLDPPHPGELEVLDALLADDTEPF